MSQTNSVLITGSTGFLGYKIVETLISAGYKVRAFVRKTSKTDRLKSLGVEICVGDIANISSLRVAFEGINYIVHAAADTIGSVDGGKASTIQGTENVLTLCKEFKVRKLVYISSCSVYGVADYKKGYVVTEESYLESTPESRGAYSNAKFQAEKAVLLAMAENVYPIVCLRPGTIYGPGGEIYTPMMGWAYSDKMFLTIGDGQFILPLVYIDNVADAARAVLAKENGGSSIYNVIDPYQITKKLYNMQLVKKVFPRARFFYFPYSLLYMIVHLQELFLKLIGRPAFLSRYRLESSQKSIVYDGNKICRELNWVPPVSMDEALNRIFKHEIQKRV